MFSRAWKLKCKNLKVHEKKKTRKLLQHWKTDKCKDLRDNRREYKRNAHKDMTFHITLNDELRTKYKSLPKGKKKGLFDVVKGKLVRTYKLICKASRELRISGGRTRPLKGSLTKRKRKLVRSFYQRDDISRLTAGIKETITRSEIKK